MSAAVLFDAVLSPHRSMPARNFALVLAVLCVPFPLLGLAFAAAGAWPVLPFFGAEMLLLWWAFRASRREARRRETLRLTPQALTLRRISPSGRTWQGRLAPPHWARAVIERRRGGADRLIVTSHGRRMVVGAFLSDDEKRTFATALNAALGRLRGDPAAADGSGAPGRSLAYPVRPSTSRME